MMILVFSYAEYETEISTVSISKLQSNQVKYRYVRVVAYVVE